MSTTTLVSQLKDRSAKATERKKQEAASQAKKKDEQRQAEDLEKVNQIIKHLPGELLAASEKESRYKVMGDIQRIHPVALEALKRFLDDEQIGWEEKHEFDPGTDSNWRDLWAFW